MLCACLVVVNERYKLEQFHPNAANTSSAQHRRKKAADLQRLNDQPVEASLKNFVQDLKNANRSALITSGWVVNMPCGYPA